MSAHARLRRGWRHLDRVPVGHPRGQAPRRRGGRLPGVEMLEYDLVMSPWSPRRVAEEAAGLGLSIEVYQPFHVETVPPDLFGGQPAPRRAEVRPAVRTRRERAGVLLVEDRRRASTTTTWPRSSCTRWPTAPRSAACGSPTRPCRGAGSARTRMPGASSSGPTIPRSACVSTASTCCPVGNDPARSSPGGRRQGVPRPAGGRAATRTWTSASGASTTGCSPARARSTWRASSAGSWPWATPARWRSRCSTTSTSRRIPGTPPSTRCAPCSRSRRRWPRATPEPRPSRSPRGDLPPAPRARRASRSPSSRWTRCRPRSSRARWPRSGSPTSGSTAPSRCSCGSRARARVLLNLAPQRSIAPATASICALAVESSDPAASMQRADRLLAPKLPGRRGPTRPT